MSVFRAKGLIKKRSTTSGSYTGLTFIYLQVIIQNCLSQTARQTDALCVKGTFLI